MEPRIQYARTSDGVSIAYFTIGEGPAVVMMPGPLSNIQAEFQIPGSEPWHNGIGAGRLVVRFDPRGMGLSDRNVSKLSVDTYVEDLRAVVDRLELERLALLAPLSSSLPGIKYAALNPERVTHLVLWCGAARGRHFTSRSMSALRPVRNQDWETYTEAAALAVSGWSAGDATRAMAEASRTSTTPEIANAHTEMNLGSDVSDLLDQIRCPTLVIHRKGVTYPPLDAARELVAGIPNAELALLEGDSMVPYFGDVQAAVRVIHEFIGGAAVEPAQPTATPAAQDLTLRTILFTDIEGSTALTQRLGDTKAREVFREHERITREVLAAHGGAEVKTMGDGFMAAFGSTSRAVECAIALQRRFGERTADDEIRIRIGLNAGEPIAEDDDLFGTAVIVAARIAAKAAGGEILVSDVVRQLVAGKGFLFNDCGETELRGFEDPVRIYEVNWSSASPSAGAAGGSR